MSSLLSFWPEKILPSTPFPTNPSGSYRWRCLIIHSSPVGQDFLVPLMRKVEGSAGGNLWHERFPNTDFQPEPPHPVTYSLLRLVIDIVTLFRTSSDASVTSASSLSPKKCHNFPLLLERDIDNHPRSRPIKSISLDAHVYGPLLFLGSHKCLVRRDAITIFSSNPSTRLGVGFPVHIELFSSSK